MGLRDLWQAMRATGERTPLSYHPVSPLHAYAAQSLSDARLGRAEWPRFDPGSFDARGYQRLSLIYRCVNLIAHAAGTAPLRVYDEARDNETVEDHPLRALMRQPNPVQGEALFIGDVALRMAVAGFCVVEKERNRLGQVIALWPLNSAWLKAKRRRDGRYDWEYRVPGVVEPYPLRAEDVIAFRWANDPSGSPYGVAPINVCFRDATLIARLIDFLGVLVERGGVPLYGLIPDLLPGQTINQDKADELVERWLRRHGGVEKAGIPALLTGIKDVKRLGFDLDELAYTDLRDVSELAIVQAFGVPPTKAMIRVGLEHSDSRANAEVDDRAFYQDAIVPLWTRMDDALTSGLLPEFESMPTTRALEFDKSDIQALQEDRNQRAPWLIDGFSRGGFSHHTLHRELGLPVPETDDFYLRGIAVEAIPVETPIVERPALGDGSLSALPSGQRLSGRGPRERLATANRRTIQRIAETRAGSIRAYFAGLEGRVLKALEAPVGALGAGNGANGRHETYALQDLDWDREERLLGDVMTRLYTLAGQSAFAAVSGELNLGLAWDLANPRVRAVMGQLAGRVVGINQSSRDLIQETVTKALEEGVSLEQLRDRLKGQFAGWTEGRAMTIARTESQVSYNTASTLAYRESGVVDRLQLFDNEAHTESYAGAEDGLTCAERHGKVVPLADGELHIRSEHPNGSLAVAGVLIGEDG